MDSDENEVQGRAITSPSKVSFAGISIRTGDSAVGTSRYGSFGSRRDSGGSEDFGSDTGTGTYGSVTSTGSILSMEDEYNYGYSEDRLSMLKEDAVVSEGEIYTYDVNESFPKIPEYYEESDAYYDSDTDGTVVLSTEPLLGATAGSINNYSSKAFTSATSDSEYFSTGYRSCGIQTHSGNKQIRGPRRPMGKVSTVLIAWNVLNLLLNLSILAIPFSIASGGIVAVGLIPLISLITGYTGKILIDCMYIRLPKKKHIKTRVRRDYVELGQDFTNSKTGGLLIQFLQVTEMFAICILNINVLGKLSHEILKNHLAIHVCTAIGATFALPTFFVRKLSVIAWMQLMGILSLTIGMILIEIHCVGNVDSWTISNIPLYDLELLPVSAGILIFANGLHPVLPGIEQQMKQPKQYRRMLIFTFLIAAIVNGFFGSSNALLYGKETDQVITVDLETHLSIGVSSAVFIFISVICLFALPTIVVMEGIDAAIENVFPVLKKPDSGHNIWLSFAVRFVMTALSMTVAMFVPHFALLMGLIGSSVSTLLSLIIPCLLHIKLKRNNFRWYHYVLDTAIIIFGVFVFVTGIYFSGKAMNRKFLT